DAGGCPSPWGNDDSVHDGDANPSPNWLREGFSVGSFVSAAADDIQIALGVVDLCGVWCGVFGSGACHSHSPLFDQVRLLRVNHTGPQWTVADPNLWQDNFPETGGIGPSDYARCDMARTIAFLSAIIPGDSLSVTVADPNGLAADNTGGRADTKAVYVFVRVTDRFGNPVAGKNGLALQSPDVKRYSGDASGLPRYPWVSGLAPASWDAYRLDLSTTKGGTKLADTYCGDLMDLSAGPHSGPARHANENHAANTGVFAPGDVIRYFLGARNTLGEWSYWHRTYNGQGVGVQTSNIAQAMASPCEWSVLPDAGRAPGDLGDILFVDDSDDRGGPAQVYFDIAFQALGIADRVDRFDVLGPSSAVSNGLAGRVKNFHTQMIGGTTEIYQKILWNTGDLSIGLMGDGGQANGGTGSEKSNDFALCDSFLTHHPDNPGWAYWGSDVVQNWATLVGASAASVKSKYMNHSLAGGNQTTATGLLAPMIHSVAGTPWDPETFYPVGGCPALSDFDMPGATGASSVSHRYNDQAIAPAALYQASANTAGSTARFFFAGFGFNFIRDDDTDGVSDYATHLHETLLWMENLLPSPTGIDPVAFANGLENAYPNPFNPTTTIRYSIASPGRVTLNIYNASGQLVRTLVDEDQTPAQGGFSKVWDGMNSQGNRVASGVYFYRLTAGDFSQTKKMVLLK
ncbi:MAG: Por secretion system C-terminal sorting protein, partial [Candidatus Krumholzibacteriota bacterium]|nr:Por secretion system C-terminal sorting protein [Candidatus Krumholzibacteriota bacterium]